jgi:hypothetical protein
LAVRDRAWLAMDNLRVIGPLAGITVAGLRDALVRLHDARPAYHPVSRLDRSGLRWEPLSRPDFSRFCHDLVVPVPLGFPGPDGAADAVTRWLVAEPLADRPLLLAVCKGFVGAKISHGLGDGRVVNTLFPELLRATATGSVPRPPFPNPVAFPTLRALAHHFGRHPARLRHALRVVRPPVSTVDGRVPWHPEVRYRSVRSGTALAEVRAWRDRYAPGISAAAILFTAAVSALTRCGLTPRWPGAVVLVDARRYLPDGATVDGNFSWGQYLCPTDLTDPRAVHDSLTAELDSGRPLAMLALRTARLALRRPAPVPPIPGVSPDPRPELTLTHIGKLDAYTGLPWTGPVGAYRNISVPTTSGPEAVTISFSELTGALYVNVSFHGSTFDPETVYRAVELLCHDPIGLAGLDPRSGLTPRTRS